MPKIADIEYTPNPNAVKFILKEPVTSGQSRSYQNAETALVDPLANALFNVGNVTSVFYMDRFITINKEEDVSWEIMLKKLADPIRSAPAISEHAAGATAPHESASYSTSSNTTGYVPGENPVIDKINEILDERIRPGLAGDGGGIEILGLNDKKLLIRYQGACGSCPSSLSGTMMYIEGLLRDEIDPELEVISV